MADFSETTYRGELHRMFGGIDMYVTRDVVRPSGLHLLTTLAYVMFRDTRQVEISADTDLVLPSMEETAAIHASRTEDAPLPGMVGNAIESMSESNLTILTGRMVARGVMIIDSEGLSPVSGSIGDDLSEQEAEAARSIHNGLKKHTEPQLPTGMYL